jgi:hypothetical protein
MWSYRFLPDWSCFRICRSSDIDAIFSVYLVLLMTIDKEWVSEWVEQWGSGGVEEYMIAEIIFSKFVTVSQFGASKEGQ